MKKIGVALLIKNAILKGQGFEADSFTSSLVDDKSQVYIIHKEFWHKGCLS